MRFSAVRRLRWTLAVEGETSATRASSVAVRAWPSMRE
jgi:hypothetical protein